ncbi:hypothetical protein RQM59_04475 [Flavobacteriaceae bacterium S356]|uniref:Tetratricopeptide repeat protein n=1 Tax=Asprobacillus argus TaxID=3076534 RepID=A0ABU3LD28_9FLAO|nr:hypothetical protein [Flavobacteriaceae bacterium S356]
MKRIVLIVYVLLWNCWLVQSQNIKQDLSELENIGYVIDSTLYSGDDSFFNKKFDTSALIKRMNLPEHKSLSQYNEGFERGFKSSFKFGKLLLREIENGASYDFIRAYEDSRSRLHLLFRLFSDEGLNYHDFLVVKENGKVKLVDAFVYTTGENLSESLKAMYDLARMNEGGIISKLFKRDDYLTDLVKLKEVRALKAQGKFKESYDLFKSLGEKSKKTKVFRLLKISVTSNLDENLYKKSIREYLQAFPNNPSVYLVSIDGHILNKKYDEALKMVDKLNDLLQGDDFLNYLRGNIFYAKKDYKMATSYFVTMTNDFEHFFDPYDSLLTIYIETNQYDKAVEILSIMMDSFKVVKKELKSSVSEYFSEFSKSKEFNQWLKSK